jgi:hypothetical protein
MRQKVKIVREIKDTAVHTNQEIYSIHLRKDAEITLHTLQGHPGLYYRYEDKLGQEHFVLMQEEVDYEVIERVFAIHLVNGRTVEVSPKVFTDIMANWKLNKWVYHLKDDNITDRVINLNHITDIE